MSPDEKIQIWEEYFGLGKTQIQIAKTLGCHLNTVKHHIHSKEGREMEKKIQERMGRAARGRLARAAEEAADSWIQQLENANTGARAQHLPARDLLTHIGAIDIAVPNTAKGTQILIQIGSGTPSDVQAEVIDVTPTEPSEE
jgi:DNA-binding NarL/FixJ family response regulator